MKKEIALILMLLTYTQLISAQSITPEQDVRNVIVRLFDGMKNSDSTMAGSVLRDDVQLFSVYTDANGSPVILKESAEDWLVSIATPHDQPYFEEIWDEKVEIDGNLAQLWTNYAFYVGNRFSHCGVDAFQLFFDGSDWKIFHIADTRRKDCDIPDRIKAKHQ